MINSDFYVGFGITNLAGGKREREGLKWESWEERVKETRRERAEQRKVGELTHAKQMKQMIFGNIQ